MKWLFPFWINMTVPCFIFLTGYVSALSLKRQKVATYEDAVANGRILKKMIRFVIPFTMAFIAEWILLRLFGIYMVNIFTYGPIAFCLDYIRGGVGMGSYYVPLMIQCVIVFPVIYFVVKKYQLKGVIYCFVANALFEVLKTAYYMNDAEYRLLIFRYIFILSAGVYVAICEIKKTKVMLILCTLCFVIGLFFLYLFSYTAYEPKIIQYWSTTSFVVCLYIVPVMGFLVSKVKLRCYPLELIGKSSYNIFLVQMIYYVLSDKVYELFPLGDFKLICNIVICVVIGVLFYYIEKPITGSCMKLIDKYFNKKQK